MNQLQEVGILLKKRREQLERKKQRCLDYSTTPNKCVAKVEAQIKRLEKVTRVARMRTKALESESFVDLYLSHLYERKKIPAAKAVTYGLAGVAGYKVTKRIICKKQHKRNPYLYKQCIKGLDEAEGWSGTPKGWKQSSIKKFSKSLTGKDATQKGFFDKCVKRMRGKLDNPEAFCAATKDERHGSTFWRGKGKSPQQAGRDVRRFRNVKQEALERIQEDEWRGPNIPYGDDSDRPNLIRKCTMLESPRMKINCLRKLRDQAAMNPFYQYRIDRYIDEITDTYESTRQPGTIPGNEFKVGNVGEDR